MFNKNKTYEQHDNEKISFYRSSIEDLNSQDNFSSTVDVDICVIGGGLTGVMMATALSHAGVDVVLVDRDGGRTSDSDERTTTINAAGARMLAALCVWDRLPTPPAPVRRIAIAEGPTPTGLAARRHARRRGSC